MKRLVQVLSAAALVFFSLTFAFAQSSDPQVATDSKSACAAVAPNPSDIHAYHPDKANPESITPPKVLHSVNPKFPRHHPKAPFDGTTFIALVVDTNGKPQQVHVDKSLGSEFDKNALAAVEQYRFAPALRDGKPIPTAVCVQIRFRLYKSLF